MACAGCNPGLAVHVGAWIKYWCPHDGTYHFDWEPCQASSPQPPAPPDGSLPPNGGSAPPVAGGGGSPVGASSPQNLSSMTGGRNCGCCGGASAAPASSAAMVAATPNAVASSPCAGCTGCGDKKSPWLLMLAAVVLVALAVAALSDG